MQIIICQTNLCNNLPKLFLKRKNSAAGLCRLRR